MRTSRVSLLGAGLGLAALATLVPLGTAVAGVTPGAGCGATAGSGSVACEFYAVGGTLAVPGGSVDVMGYSDSASGPPILPGPSIVAAVGDDVTVTLHNRLSQPTGMLFQEQPMTPDTTGAPANGDVTYHFTPSAAGTYLYEASPFVTTAAGGGSQYQTAMGMSGALVVRPAATPDRAYADVSTRFDTEHLVVVSELDKQLTAANAATFDMRAYAPDYFLVNGKASPQTADLTASAGQTVLLRYVNAGVKAHSVALLGQDQTVVGEDGNALGNPRRIVAETLGAGQTDDVLVDLPADAAGRYPLYDAGLSLNNNTAAGMGGMLTFLNVAGPAATPPPATSNVRVAGSDLKADIPGASSAEYFVDTVGAEGAGIAMTPDPARPGGFTVALPGSLTGPHTLYVRGAAGTVWGPVSSVIFANADGAGPLTKALGLTPNPSNGTAGVQLTATGDDSAAGGSGIAGGEYAIDGGTAVPITPNGTGPVAALDITIPGATITGLTEGPHTVSVRSRDTANNWGAPATITLTRDTTGPAGSAPTATPSPNNGTLGVSATSQTVRVTLTASDTASAIAAGEGFFDTAGVNGKGFPLVPSDGTFNSTSETLRADIPLSTITALTPGTHRILMHARDAAGNWGDLGATPVFATLLIDKTAPTSTSISLAPGTVLSPATPDPALTTTLTVNGAADTGGAGVAGGEYWINPPTTTAPAPGSGTAFSGTTAGIPVGALATGTYTVSARIRDAAGNWSTVRTATLTVIPDAIFSNGFETGGSPWGWSSASTNTAARLSATATAALVGSRGLQAQGNNTNHVQYTFGTAANPATGTFDARFYFNPDNNASTGQDILAAATTTNFTTQVFHVRYRRSGTQPQVQIQVGATANPTWTNITNNAANRIEVVWRSGTSLQLHVGGTLSQTLTTAATGAVAAVRLGSVTSGGSSTLEYFDGFSAKRSVTPLVGP